jgi:hypothetical protein
MLMFFASRPVNIVLMLICALVVFSGIRQILRERRTEGVPLAAALAEASAGIAGRGISMRFADVFLGLLILLLAGAGFWEVQRLSERGGQFPILVLGVRDAAPDPERPAGPAYGFVNYGRLPSCSAGPCDRGNLCRRRPERGRGGGWAGGGPGRWEKRAFVEAGVRKGG